MVLSSFFTVGLITNIIEFGRKKKDALYQLAWSVYVGAFIGFISLLRAWMNDGDPHVLLKSSVYYASYLFFSLIFIRVFHIKFQYFSWSTGHKTHPKKPIDPDAPKPPLTTREKNIKASRSLWNLLNPVFMIFFGWLFIFQLKIFAFCFHAVRFLIPGDAFMFV